MDLPDNAVLNPDGTVTVRFDRPFDLTFREPGRDPRTESYDHIVLRRLNGVDMRRVFAAKNSTELALAISAGLTQAKLALMQTRMDGADLTAANMAVAELLGGMKDGLPDHAVENADGGVTLPLLYPATDGDGETHDTLVFNRLTGLHMKGIGTSKVPLQHGIHAATGLTLKAAKGLFDAMDGADALAAQAAINFLSGIGRRTGR